ncbi:DUF2637 domain-containing protein [Streptomyces sp. NPDC056580]|uniref:DUF2637 domain-containing protein n=1 Tax=Streptomyces sp. NPDC056580 TaxID=3345872 RepID=UPI0036A9CC3E
MNNEYADFYSTAPLEEGWDPVEELTYLLQDAASAQAAQQAAAVPPPRGEPPYGTEPLYGTGALYGTGSLYGTGPLYGAQPAYAAEPLYGTESPYRAEPGYATEQSHGAESAYRAESTHRAEPPYGAENSYGPEPPYGAEEHAAGDPLENLAPLTSELPPIRRHPAGHRKVRMRTWRITWLETVSCLIAALAAVIVAMVSVFGGLAAYAPLQHIAARTQSGPLHWWPLLVYGPWTVASLSILRTALHRRRALHSWCVVLLFSSVAMVLCVAESERSFIGVAAAVLPALAALTCFQQLVRQVTLTRPPRQRISRHRQRTAQGVRAR